MITLPTEHLLHPFRQHAPWGDTGGNSDVATLKPPGQCPLPSPPHAAPYGELRVSRASSRARSQMVAGISEGPGYREKAQREAASFISTSSKIKKKTSTFLESHRLGDNNVFVRLFLSICHIFLSLLLDSELFGSLVCI